jgi:hypothetical protein
MSACRFDPWEKQFVQDTHVVLKLRGRIEEKKVSSASNLSWHFNVTAAHSFQSSSRYLNGAGGD